jgi:hypothetical protein
MQRLGTHLVRLEGDFMSLQWNGDFHLEDLQGFLLLAERVLLEHGRLFVLVDSGGAGKMQADARKHVVTWRSPGPICAAFFGASFTVRVIVNTVSAAVRLLNGKQPMPFHFAESEEAARGWLDAHRQAPVQS